MVHPTIARTTPALFGLFSLVMLWAADPNIVFVGLGADTVTTQQLIGSKADTRLPLSY
jgi:hypothetical protein